MIKRLSRGGHPKIREKGSSEKHFWKTLKWRNVLILINNCLAKWMLGA